MGRRLQRVDDRAPARFRRTLERHENSKTDTPRTELGPQSATPESDSRSHLRDDIAPHWPLPPEGRPGIHRCTITGNPTVILESHMSSADGDHGVHAGTLDLPYTPSAHFEK